MGINHQIGDIPVGVIELLFKQFLTTFFIKLKSFFIFVCFWLSSRVRESNSRTRFCRPFPNHSDNPTSKNRISTIPFLSLHMAGKISLSFQAVTLLLSATERVVPTVTIRISNVLSYVVTFRFYSTTIMRLLCYGGQICTAVLLVMSQTR